MMRKQVEQKVRRRPTANEQLATSVSQDYAHASTAIIGSRKRVLEYELVEVEREIAMLSGATTAARERKAKVEATLRGLTEVVTRRCAGYSQTQ